MLVTCEQRFLIVFERWPLL